MGQRLVINITQGEKILCNIYYHWSAYTFDALDETQRVVSCIKEYESKPLKDLLLGLIRHCENSGGGIVGGADWEYIKALYPNEEFKTEGISRNDGLISFSDEGIQESLDWSEGNVYIDLDTKAVYFGIYCEYDSLEYYIEERKSWDDEFEGIELEDIYDINCDLGMFPMDKIDEVVLAMNNAYEYDSRVSLVRHGNSIYELTR